MQKLNMKNMLKGMQVPKEIKELVEYHLNYLKVNKDKYKNTTYYMCIEHPVTLKDIEQAKKFNDFVEAFINKYCPAKYINLKSSHGMYIIMKDYYYEGSFTSCSIPYAKGIEFRIEFLTQVLAHINGTFTVKPSVPRKQKMSDTKLYKSLKHKMQPEEFKVVYNNLKPIWKTWTTDKDSSLFPPNFKGFDTPYIWEAFRWSAAPQGPNYWYNVAAYFDNK